MARKYAHLPRASLLSTPRANYEEIEIDDAIPLVALSQRTSEALLHNNSLGDHETVSVDQVSAGDSIASCITGTKITTAEDAAPKTSQRWTPRKLPTPIMRISKAWDLRLRQSRFHGWRMGVLFGCCMSFFVLSCNIALVAVGATSKSGYDDAGISTIVQGDEVLASRWNTGLHVLINALSTILLSSSNYTMQVLNSPTREDVDIAHAKEEWLDIGRLSLRNFRAISWSRTCLCFVLALSSMPLHLFYNASVFKVVTTRENYYIRTMDIASFAWSRISHRTDNSDWSQGEYWNLSASRWNEPYSKQHVSIHGDLYLAIDRVAVEVAQFRKSINYPRIASDYIIRNMSMTIDRATPQGSDWNPSGWQSLTSQDIIMESPEWLIFSSSKLTRINHWCAYDWFVDNEDSINTAYPGTLDNATVRLHVAQAASRKALQNPSTVQVSRHFLIVVLCFNFIKFITMLLVLVTDRSAYLVTLGDAASSFLERNDPHTVHKCLLSREGIISRKDLPRLGPSHNNTETEDLRRRLKGIWLPYSRSYFSPFHTRAMLIYILLTVVSASLFAAALARTLMSHSAWGTSSTSYMNPAVGPTVATLWSAWLSNVPQVLLSFCYFSINLVCTSMAAAEEWNNLATSRKGLRVTQPYGHQRSTYFLQLPYRWSLPLTIISGTLHWLVSQSFFLVRTETLRFGPSSKPQEFDNARNFNTTSTSACGFSALGFVVALFVLFVLLGTVGAVGLRMRQIKVPVVASCSLAISAACHPPPGDINAHLAEVQWGVTQDEVITGFGHCSLSSKPVTEPEEGRAYY